MNYEKKYKEAMDRMELCVRSGLKITPEYIFPELAESEDEKVRKEIINFFQCQSVKNPSRKDIHNKWIAWLEKQDTKKYEEELENAYKTADKVQYKRGYEDAVKEMEKQGETFPVLSNSSNIGKNEQKHFDYENANIQQKDFAPKVEQKPEGNKGNIGGISPNLSEEDAINVYNIIHFLEEPSMLENNEPCKKIVINWLKSLQDRVQPSPKK